MPAPTTIECFLEMVEKSGLLEGERLRAIVKKTPSEDPAKLAAALVRAGLLTTFQSEQLIKGKWKGFKIGKYKVLERLGSGGMGNVFLCEHESMRSQVAIKVLAHVNADDPHCLKRFYREARAAAALEHPNIVRAFDVGVDGKLHFLVMEYVHGNNLYKIVKAHGPMDVLRASHYIRQAALGLQWAHRAGVVHRDIKPANIILSREGTAKVLDMGLARFLNRDEELLTEGLVLGSADYLAPEQALNSHDVDSRADIYGLGATFYFLLTGRAPMEEGKTLAQKMYQLQSRAPKPIRELRPNVPEGLAEIVEKMMAKDPAQRYQSLQEVIDFLAWWTRSPMPPPPENEMPQFSPAARSASATRSNFELTLPSSNLVNDLGVVSLPEPVASDGASSLVRATRTRWLWWIGTAVAAMLGAGIGTAFVFWLLFLGH